jgi:prepilin-type N-terminal cleavage/methylation domain-containing protein
MKTQLKQGFTMIEMLVVIVIIGILAGSLFGPVTNFMLQGNLTAMMGNGRKVVQAIIAADMTGRYQGFVWPSDENADSAPETKLEGPDMYKSFTTTADYFNEALYTKAPDVKKQESLKVLKDIDASAIAGQGVPTASKEIRDTNCAWALAKNVAGAPAKSPVFVTRNLDIQKLVNVVGNGNDVTADSILKTVAPFQKDGCVIIYKDGSGKKFGADEIFNSNLVGGLGSGKLSDFEQGEGSKFTFLTSGK